MKNWAEAISDVENTDSLFNTLTAAFKEHYKRCVERLVSLDLEKPIDPAEQTMLKDFLLSLYSLEVILPCGYQDGEVVEFLGLKEVVISDKKTTSVRLNALKQATLFILKQYHEEVFEYEYAHFEYKNPSDEEPRNATTVEDGIVVEVLGEIFTSIFEPSK